MQNKTKIIIAVALPVLILLFVVGSVLLPRLFFTPKYDFIYTLESGCNYYCNGWTPYSVKNDATNTSLFGTLQKNPLPEVVEPGPTGTVNPPAVAKGANPHYPPLYLYQAATNTFRKISFEEAQTLGKLIGDGSAPDGSVVSGGYRSRGLFGEIFGGGYSNYQNLYLRNGTWSKEITVRNTATPDYYYDASNFRLISWVEYLRL